MQVLANYIQSLEVDRLKIYKDISLCFLKRQHPTNLVVLNYDEGLITKGMRVKELDGGGDVNFLKFINESLFSIFVPQGVILLGLLQHRATAHSFLIKPRQELVIPVFCIEEGRFWTTETNTERLSPYQLYPRLKKSIKRKRTTTQNETWAEIKRLREKSNIQSSYGFVGDAYDAHKSTIEDYIKNLRPPEHSIGFIAIFKGEYLLCVESFGNDRLFKRNFEGLLSGIALETTDDDFYEELKGKETITVEEVLRGIASVSINTQRCKSLGDSHEYYFDNSHFEGSMLVSGDVVYHVEALV
jgi:hypothetical protein